MSFDPTTIPSKDGQPVTWNTGRLYTRHGQRMAATFDPATGRVVFVDHDRGIQGEFLAEAPTRSTLRALVDSRYLHSDYDMPRGSSHTDPLLALVEEAARNAPSIAG